MLLVTGRLIHLDLALADEATPVYLAQTRPATSTAYAHSISLDLFDPHFGARSCDAREEPETGDQRDDAADDDDDPDYYTHPCRCSSRFKVTREQLEQGVEVVGCEGCSERCRVEYDVVEEEEA
ncbi:hypothetical protein JCM10212_000310 [Sporobolomyces blumeae]